MNDKRLKSGRDRTRRYRANKKARLEHAKNRSANENNSNERDLHEAENDNENVDGDNSVMSDDSNNNSDSDVTSVHADNDVDDNNDNDTDSDDYSDSVSETGTESDDNDDEFSDALDFTSDDEQDRNDNLSSDNDSDDDGGGGEGEEDDNNDHNDDNGGDNFRRKISLIEWALKHNISHVALDDLLSILIRYWAGEGILPKCSKTLLGTLGARYAIRPMRDINGNMGEFTYCGIQYGLEQCINPEAHEAGHIDLQFHCDGLSVSKSSNSDVWPILCRVYSKAAKYEPFVVSMFHGKSKPMDVNEYLTDFVLEMNELLEHGVTVAGRQFQVHLQCIIADTPARAFLKSIQGHTGAHACERCSALGRSLSETNQTDRPEEVEAEEEEEEEGGGEVEELGSQSSQRVPGRRVRKKKKKIMVFPDISEDSRTDESFRNFTDDEHHKGTTLLTNIIPPIDMVLIFVLDFMHLGFLGIMKQLLKYWFSSSRYKVSERQKQRIEARLQQIRKQIPLEFARKIRSINDYAKYKATELKFFALYAGPLLLKTIMPDEQYYHFISFHYASRLLWSQKTARNTVDLARHLLQHFFMRCKAIYGQTSASINMHNLNHVADDVVYTGLSLSEINAFPFENHLGIIKRKLRSPYHLLAQICRRTHESNRIAGRAELIPEIEVEEGARNTIKKIKYKENWFTKKRPNNMILLNNNYIMEIQSIYRNDNDIFMTGHRWIPKGPIYRNDFVNSVNQEMYELNDEAVPGRLRWNLNQVKNKLIRLDIKLEEDGEIKKFVIPMLHE